MSHVTSAQEWHDPHFSNKALPSFSVPLTIDKLAGTSATDWHIEISTFHVKHRPFNVTCQVLKALNKAKRRFTPLPSSAGGWLADSWLRWGLVLPGWLSQLVELSLHPPPPKLFTHFPTEEVFDFPKTLVWLSTFSIFPHDLQKRLALFKSI